MPAAEPAALPGGDDLATLPCDTTRWYRHGYLVRLNYILLCLVLYSSTCGYDGSVMSGLEALDSWKEFMGNPAGANLGWITAIYWLGSALGIPVAAWAANRFGRRPGIFVGYLFLALGVGLQAGAPCPGAFTASRLFVGFSAAWFSNAAPLLINELAHPRHRAIANAAFMCGWYAGGTLCGWVTFACRTIPSNWSWRIPVLLQLLLPLVALPGLLMAPESPRWLVSVGRSDKAAWVLGDCHTGGDHEHPLIQRQMSEIQATLAVDEAASRASYIDMLRTPGNRHRLFISVSLGIFSQWCGNGVVSYYLPLILDSINVTSAKDQTLVSACLNVWNLLWAIAAAFCVDRLGRRFLLLASAIVMLSSFIIVTGLSGSYAETQSSSVGLAVLPFLFTFFAGYDIGMTPMLTAYPCEIWPYSLRSRGLSVTWAAATIAIFINTFVNPIALGAIGWKYYIVFIAILVLLLVTIFFTYPETRRHTLEQTAAIFDVEPETRSSIVSRSTMMSTSDRKETHVEVGPPTEHSFVGQD